MRLAKVRHRFMASLLDFGVMASFLAIIALIKFPFTVSLFLSGEPVEITTKLIVDVFRWGILFSVILFVYYIMIPLLLNGQTFGKRVFKLKIVKESNDNVDLLTMFYREGIGRVFINMASLGITAIVSLVIMILREDNKSLGDILAKTKVIDLYESEE